MGGEKLNSLVCHRAVPALSLESTRDAAETTGEICEFVSLLKTADAMMAYKQYLSVYTQMHIDTCIDVHIHIGMHTCT